MPDKHRRKTPEQPEKRRPKHQKSPSRGAAAVEISRSVAWLPDDNADFMAWSSAAERAYQDFRIAWDNFNGHPGDTKLERNYSPSVREVILISKSPLRN